MSTLTPRELVQRTLRFESTPRVPRQVWAGPLAAKAYPDELAALRRDFPDDIHGPEIHLPPVDCVRGDPEEVGTYVDEWGCAFVTLQQHVMGEVRDPLVKSYTGDLDKVRPPWAWVEINPDPVNRSCAASDGFMAALAPIRPFERMQFLRGTENLLKDIARRPAGFFTLRERVHEWACALLTHWVQTDIDGIVWYDDWGTQQNLLIRPQVWRELFKPLYADYVQIIHDAGKFAFMHSDGHIFDIYEDLIEIGIDAINSQLFCMDIEEIGRRFRGRITFWGEIDRQRLLAFGTADETRAAVQRVAQALYRGHGGVIAQCEFGPGCRPDTVRAVFEKWDRIGTGSSDVRG
ncbi:MAG: methyltransferase [Phycisphaerales bacterium]|nr:methyltransferase [Phycisphaerales bacterium]